MASISECENDIRRYERLKDNIFSVIDKLSSASSSAYNLSIELKNKYQVDDGNTPVTSRVTTLKNNIEKTSTSLKNKVIPAIDRAINDLKKEIERLIEEERLEEEQNNA